MTGHQGASKTMYRLSAKNLKNDRQVTTELQIHLLSYFLRALFYHFLPLLNTRLYQEALKTWRYRPNFVADLCQPNGHFVPLVV